MARPLKSARRAQVPSGLRLPSLTGLLVRVLVIGFVAMAAWRLGMLALETYEAARFTRPTIVPQTPPQRVPDGGLERVLQGVGLPGGVVGVYVRNLTTGETSGQNADRRFVAASLYKVPVLVEVYKQQRLKKFTWDEELTIGRDQWTDGSGILQARVGERVKIGELMRLMIAESDNIAANILVDLVGPANINQTMDGLGLKTTHVVDRFRESMAPTTSPEDMGKLLELIATGRLVDASTSEEAMSLLEQKQAQAWLATGLPWWGKLAHKWGDVPNGRHDAGVIYTPHNQVVLAVLTENGSPAAAAEQISSISKRVMTYFEGAGP
jgi:beta-lactamase class A